MTAAARSASAMISWKLIVAANVDEIARACDISTEQIEDVYDCTPLQISMISQRRDEVFHFIISFGATADIERFINALQQVVERNPALRTRIVDCSLGLVQVAVKERHTTTYESDNLERCLRKTRAELKLGAPLFRSMFVGRTFVATIHHAVMDYWSLTTLLEVDVRTVFINGTSPAARPPFRRFVEHVRSIDQDAARSFWASRFEGRPVTFPAIESVAQPKVVQGNSRKIELKCLNNGLLATQAPYFIEAAWAVTSSIYSDNEKVAYGYVLSGRSIPLEGDLEKTLGPTIVELPIQVNVRKAITVDRMIKDRATSVRQLQGSPALHYSKDKIAAVSSAAKIATGFQTLLNVRPAFRSALPNTGAKHGVSYDEMQWFGGIYPLQLVFSIMEDCIWVEPRYDSASLSPKWLDQVLTQFDHVLQAITASPLETKLADLSLLSSHDRSKIFDWNACFPEPMIEVESQRDTIASSFRERIRLGSLYTRFAAKLPGCCFWIVNPQNIHELSPIGAVGEILIECSRGAEDHFYKYFDTLSLITISPKWSPRTSTNFYRTGDLTRYNFDGDILFVGQKSNRIKIKDQTIQLEEIESVLEVSKDVSDVVTLCKITRGWTQLIAVVCLTETQLMHDGVLEDLPDIWAYTSEKSLNIIRYYASVHLPAERVPSVWYVVQRLPRTASDRVDRKAVYNWVKARDMFSG